MTTTTDGAREGEIERRVVEWVTAALSTSGTTDGVGVDATATRAAALPDDGLEVQPEDWNVEVVLRFSETDEARSGDALGAIAEATGTVTLEGGDAAEIDGPSAPGDLTVARAADAPEDEPFRCAVPVHVTIPWPSRNDAAAGPA